MERVPVEDSYNPETPDKSLSAHEMAQLQHAHERYGVPLNIDIAVTRTLEHHGFSIASDSPMRSPIDHIVYRMNQGTGRHPGFNYPNFVVKIDSEADGEPSDSETLNPGDIAFAKLAYARNTAEVDGETVQIGGLKQEKEVIEALSRAGYQMPQVLGYYPSYSGDAEPNDEPDLEALYLEAMPPDVGGERNTEDWTPEHAKIAAQKIRTFAKPKADIPLFKDADPTINFQELKARTASWHEDGGEYSTTLKAVEDMYPYLGVQDQIVVHGDTWPRNVIVRFDGEDMVFVDWELAAPGYLGQDAARLLWGLSLDSDWQFRDDIGENAEAFIEEWCHGEDSGEEDALTLQFGVMLESLRWIGDRQRDMKNADEATRTSLASEIVDIKAHALKMLERIA